MDKGIIFDNIVVDKNPEKAAIWGDGMHLKNRRWLIVTGQWLAVVKKDEWLDGP